MRPGSTPEGGRCQRKVEAAEQQVRAGQVHYEHCRCVSDLERELVLIFGKAVMVSLHDADLAAPKSNLFL